MTRPARIPSDVSRPDRVVGPFTARQAAILAGTGATLYLLWIGLRSLLTPPLFLAGAVPVAAAAVVIALGQRDGLSMDRLLIAALCHRLTPRALPSDPAEPSAPGGAGSIGEVPGWIGAHTTVDDNGPWSGRGRRPSGFPARAVTRVAGGRGPGGVGVVDLGPDGLVVIAVASTVNFALRTPAEQDGLVAGFARYLHALGGPVQILIRALPVDLHTHLQHLHTQARRLAHPALAIAAHSHLNHLAQLAQQDGDNALLTPQVLLVLREPGRPGSPTSAAGPTQSDRRQPSRRQPRHLGREAGMGAAEQRLLRRLHDATTLLAAIDVSVTVLDAAHTTAVLVATCNPHLLDATNGLDENVIYGSTRDDAESDNPPDSDQTPDHLGGHTEHDEYEEYDGYDRAGPGRRRDTYDDPSDGTRNLNDLNDLEDLEDLAAWDVDADPGAADDANRDDPLPDDVISIDVVSDDVVPDDARWGAESWTAPPALRAAGSEQRRWTR
jgi:hypothetical protein